jgi:hypothetical protein
MTSDDPLIEQPRLLRGLSPNGYAKHRGVSRMAVNQAIAAGRLSKASTHFDGKRWHIDPVLADEEWERNTRRRRGVNAKPEEELAIAALEGGVLPFPAPVAELVPAPDVERPAATEPVDELVEAVDEVLLERSRPAERVQAGDGAGTQSMTFGPGDVPVDEDGRPMPPVLVAAIKTGIEARIKQLELEERRGQLVPIAEAAKAWAHVAQTLRDAILSVPARIAKEMAAEGDAAQVEILLERELTRALNALAEKELAA